MGNEPPGAVSADRPGGFGDGLVHVDFRKWRDRIHWQFTMRRLGEDEHGLWLWAPPGTPAQRGSDPPTAFTSTAVKLITPTSWWTAIWNEAGTHELYVDICTPARWEGDRVVLIDLDLDVTRYRDTGEVVVLDEDEFLDHQQRYEYPPQIIDGARAATARIAVALDRSDEPFDTVAKQWLHHAIDLTRQGPLHPQA